MNPCEHSIFYFHSSTKQSAFPLETGAFFIASLPMPTLLYLSKVKFPHGKLAVKWSRRRHKTFTSLLYVFLTYALFKYRFELMNMRNLLDCEPLVSGSCFVNIMG